MQSINDLYSQVEQRAKPSLKTAITMEIFGDGIKLEEVREQLKVRKLSFGQWQRAVLDGEVIPLKLNPLGRDFSGCSLREFAFRKEDFELYVNRRCPAIQIPPYLPLPMKREMTVSEMTNVLRRKWNQQQQIYLRKGVEIHEMKAVEFYDAALLGMVARRIFASSTI